MQNFPHVVSFATSRGKFCYLAREINFAILTIVMMLVKSVLKFHYKKNFHHTTISRIIPDGGCVSYPKSRLNDTFNGSLGHHTKKPPIKDEGNLMFSQRNNPYCELLRIDCKYSVFSDLNLISW
mgnify:CR=1 FL=1